MIITVSSVTNRHLKRVIEHSIYLLILLCLIPGLFYFELCIVLPAVAETWVAQAVHITCAMFLLVNIVGNMIFGMLTNTSIKGKFLNSKNRKENWTLCTVCECFRPPRSWHCNICNICILKRDHHCSFFACCVGYFNHRYFMLFTFHVFVAMIYAFIFNVKFLAQFVTWNHGLALIKFVLPLASFILDSGHESLYVFLVVINVLVAAFTGFLFFYHFNNLLKGKVTPEMKYSTKDFLYNKGWKGNLIEVFGIKWYLTWMSPFITSPLPGNGIEWHVYNKHI